MSVDLKPPRQFDKPDFTPPPSGLHYRWPDLPGPQIEERLEAKKHAVLAFAEANPIDRHIYDVEHAKFGLVTTGKAHLDTMEALRLLGIGEAKARDLGIDVYKIGMVWPLAKKSSLDFVKGKEEVLVVEEKRGIIESQFKEYFYDYPGAKPSRMVGKNDEHGNRLIPWVGELSPRELVVIIAKRLDGVFGGQEFTGRALSLMAEEAVCLQVEGATRSPYFCSGCPHNRSTKVPEGSKALAGIGCHFMASWMDRDTNYLIQMGGEGVNWVANSRFNGNKHVFQNLGDGTYYHSGILAIRQAIAAKTNITYKILFNDVTAMTGGQPADGPVDVRSIAHSLRAEGIERIALLSDDIGKFKPSDFPKEVTFDDRTALDRIQRELREIPGVTALIYDQACATEKRRRRKRGLLEDPKKFAYINQAVCEGCGDCSVTSNCLSVEPVETEFGRKRQINQNACNKDFSCVEGFCPSFVTIEGGTRRKPNVADQSSALERHATELKTPELPALIEPHNIVVTGVGGTGVITVGQLITMAAHLENKGTSVLDFMGFAQKFGPVISYVRIAENPSDIHQVRIDANAADAVIGCDIVVSSSPKASSTYQRGKTKGAINLAEMPTGDFTLNPEADLKTDQRLNLLASTLGEAHLRHIDANKAAEFFLGDSVFANVLMLGFAWQQGLVPLSKRALMRAIELNGVAIEVNKQAFTWGRVLFEKPELLADMQFAPKITELSLEEVIARNTRFLTDYQNKSWANQYERKIAQFREATQGGNELVTAFAKNLFKLMSYKDEYEVARLHSSDQFAKQINSQFEGDFKIVHHLAPPLLPSGTDSRGRPQKRAFGGWVRRLFPLLAKMKILRGTAFDPFGYHVDRKLERELITWYENLAKKCIDHIQGGKVDDILELLNLPMTIRGYGPVKEQAVRKAQAKEEEVLSHLSN